MVKRHYVPGHGWSRGRNKTHPGYYRNTRPKGRKIKLDKKPVRMYARRDRNGYIIGYSSRRPRR